MTKPIARPAITSARPPINAIGRPPPCKAFFVNIISTTTMQLADAVGAVAVDAGLRASHAGAPAQVLGRYDCLQLETPGELAELLLQAPAAVCCLIELTPRRG